MANSLDEMTEPDLKDLMSRIGRMVSGVLPPGSGFVVLAAPFDGSGIAQYVANGQRPECIRWLRETADRLEGKEDVPR